MTLLTNSLKSQSLPSVFGLMQNYPDPFKSKTNIIYQVPYKTKVVVIVISSEGEVVEKLVSKEQKPGIYTVEFCADGLPEGTYFYQLIADKFFKVKKMELIK